MAIVDVSVITAALESRAEHVCQHLLSNGYRSGRFWFVGNIDNKKGQSLRVRLKEPGQPGNWVDEEADTYGDLLDLIKERRGCSTFKDTLRQACEILSIPVPEIADNATRPTRRKKVAHNNESVGKARRLFDMAQPIGGTLAEEYLRVRGILTTRYPSMRFHPTCMHFDKSKNDIVKLPALLGAITDNAGKIIGVNRRYLNRDDLVKKPFKNPKRVLGNAYGGGVRYGQPSNIMIVGEGMETVLSLKTVFPERYCVSGGSCNHLSALPFPDGLKVLAIGRDNGRAGEKAAAQLRTRAEAENITVIDLIPKNGDFNDDLRAFGAKALRNELLTQWRNAIH